jgi:hypothetical protein
MRFEISRGGSGLTYEIRNIVLIAKKLQEFGVNIIWENIGDPVQKGEKIPDWMKEVLTEIIRKTALTLIRPPREWTTQDVSCRPPQFTRQNCRLHRKI